MHGNPDIQNKKWQKSLRFYDLCGKNFEFWIFFFLLASLEFVVLEKEKRLDLFAVKG